MGKWLEAAQPVREAMDRAGGYLTDDQAVKVAVLYRKWEPCIEYVKGDRRTYEGTLYSCLQRHMALEGWNPADSPSLWAKVLTSDTGEPLQWEQPDSTNPYMQGDKVLHNGKTWVSDVDNNVWEPGVYGWTEVQ